MKKRQRTEIQAALSMAACYGPDWRQWYGLTYGDAADLLAALTEAEQQRDAALQVLRAMRQDRSAYPWHAAIEAAISGVKP